MHSGARWLGALARAVESSIEIVAGTPDIVIAIFGLALFQQGIFSLLSFTAQGGAVFGRSFLTAGAMMSLIALPSVFAATREGLQSIPAHVREASYGAGQDEDRHHPPRPAAVGQAEHLHRRGARHGADRRRHRDRRRPARRDAAHRPRELVPGRRRCCAARAGR